MKIPTHTALIMDGNLRWAKQQNLPYIEGLRKGADAIKPLVELAEDRGIKHITFWALSTENWKRGAEFTTNLFTVFREFLGRKKLFDELTGRGGQLHIFGDLTELPADIQERLLAYLERKPAKKKIDVNFCLNYGGRAEILRAVKQIIQDERRADELTSELFSQYLYTQNQPEPDLIIRTSGEQRLSGFMPWQSVYAEFYFCPALWPDFTPQEFDKALADYASRERRFGQQSPQES